MKRTFAVIEKYIHEHGLKLTQQRLLILETIMASKGHFTADQLYEKMRQAKQPAAKATIYRTIELLVKGGFLESHTFTIGPIYYEKTLGREHHDHMVCLNCRKFIEFQCEEIESLQAEQAKRHNFAMLSHTLKLFGYCANCSRKLDRSS